MPSIEKFKESLAVFHVDHEIIELIYKDYQSLKSSSSKKEKADFFMRAQQILDEKLDPLQVTQIMDYNACCKGGSRDKASKEFAKQHQALELSEKIALIANVANMGKPVLLDEKTIKTGIYWQEGDLFKCPCPNFNGLKDIPQIPLTYCQCCAGHFRYHYQKMLGVKLSIHKIISSPLFSKGQFPCEFLFKIEES